MPVLALALLGACATAPQDAAPAPPALSLDRVILVEGILVEGIECPGQPGLTVDHRGFRYHFASLVTRRP